MIKNFRCSETELIFNEKRSRRLPNQIQNQALRKLQMLDYARHINDLRVPPSNHLEALKGNRRGQHSIRINNQWQICFVWENGHAYKVEIVDYH